MKRIVSVLRFWVTWLLALLSMSAMGQPEVVGHLADWDLLSVPEAVSGDSATAYALTFSRAGPGATFGVACRQGFPRFEVHTREAPVTVISQGLRAVVMMVSVDDGVQRPLGTLYDMTARGTIRLVLLTSESIGELDSTTLNEMIRGRTLHVGYRRLDDSVTALEFSLMGFTKAIRWWVVENCSQEEQGEKL